MMESSEELRIKLMAFVLRGYAMSGLAPGQDRQAGGWDYLDEEQKRRWLVYAGLVVASSDRLGLMQHAAEGRKTSEFDDTPRAAWRGSVSDFVTDIFGLLPKEQHVELLGELSRRLL